ncbi:hypothetical protein [Alicyclobacillus sp. SO9]|uniref:hypothetical protein n=1 Tax=Alicyclobacillus sp. SO9 TaxID=2665646 RepID=UPI0018E75795|nr:hypothetical protein [Alicyclobacillus sp. SO9]
MKIAAVIGTDNTTIRPLVEGPVIRIRDTETGEQTELENPGVKAVRGRRIAVVQEMLKHNVDVVIAPPTTFCSHSYQVARQKGIRFWNLESGTKWDDAWKADIPDASAFDTEIAPERLASHHHHH